MCKANIVPVCKKGDHQYVKNYKPVSLLQRLIYKAILKMFLDNNLGFDDELEVRSVFLDLSKAFNKLWHEGLLLQFITIIVTFPR